MVTGQTDMVVRDVAAVGARRSTVPRSVEMALRTAQMDASFVAVSVSLTFTLLTPNVRFLEQVLGPDLQNILRFVLRLS